MLEFFSQYGLFLAKTLTLLIGIIVTFATLLALSQRGKNDEGTLVISSLNEKYDDIRASMHAETLTKQELKKWHKEQKRENKNKKKIQKNDPDPAQRLFVINFDGDMNASEVDQLREIISAVIETAAADDEVIVILDSSGGFVHSYGLAASQLQRLRQSNLKLTVAIDKVAASGGYMMACVANHIIAAPFAIVGSIGVVAQLPNFHRLLDKHNVDVELHTSGEYKRTLTMFGKNTERGRRKFQEELDQTHELFKQFIQANRPQVDVEEVATGEHWHAVKAIEYNLVDEIQTSDDFILNKIKTYHVFEIGYEENQRLTDRLTQRFFGSLEKTANRLLTKFVHNRGF